MNFEISNLYDLEYSAGVEIINKTYDTLDSIGLSVLHEITFDLKSQEQWVASC